MYLLLAIMLLVAAPSWAADSKVSALTAASTPDGTELVPCVQGAASKKCTVTQIISSTAPNSATYLMQTANGSTSAEQALGALSTGCLGSTTTTGVVAARTLTGTANQITITNGDCSGTPTFSIPTNPTLPGTTTGTFTGNLTGTASLATALGANGANCSGNNFALGVDASGVGECAQPAFSNLSGSATDAQIPDTITASLYVPLLGGTLTGQLITSNLGIEFTESDTNPACAAGNYNIFVDLSETVFKKCVNGSVTAMDTGSGGGGAAGGANAVQTGDGAGTLTDSGCTAASGAMTCTSFISGSAGPGILALLEGTAPGANATAGYHNLYIDVSDSLLKTHENGGSAVTYYSTANFPTALFTNGANCSSGQFPLGVSASGASENCTALPTSITGTANQIAADASTGAITLSIPATLDLTSKIFRIPNSTTLPATCTVGDSYMDTDATTGLRFYLCQATNSWVAQGSGGGSGLTSLAAQTGATQTITRGVGIGGSSSADDHAFTFDATELTNLTFSAGGSASIVWDFNLSAGDPQVTFGNALVNITSGALQVASVAVPTISSTSTFTNKTYDAEATGNVLTIPTRTWFPAAGCNNATAGSVWDLPTSNPAVAACKTGTNTQMGVLDFADSSSLSAQVHLKLPSTWTGAIDANVKWMTTATTGDVVWQIALACVADAETDDPAFTDQLFTADTAKGTTNQTNDASKTGITTTGSCAAGELMHIRIKRDSADAGDTLAATARLLGVEIVLREAI